MGHQKQTSQEAHNIFGEVIHTYSRADAINNGVLVDVTKTAKEVGISFNIALTSAVWEGRVIPGEQAKRYGQTEKGRLWDILWMFRCAAKNNDSNMLTFKVVIYDDYSIDVEDRANEITLKAICGPGDNMEPVITIMEINNDD